MLFNVLRDNKYNLYVVIDKLQQNVIMSGMSKRPTLLELAQSKGIVRARDLQEVGLARTQLSNLVRKGQLIRLGRGIYAPTKRIVTEHDQLAQIAIKYPNSVFCLLTALQIHGLTTQSPHEVWLAIDSKARAPVMSYPPIHVIRISGSALTEGIEQKSIDGVVQIPVTSIAKTVADCFKFRNKIGLDVALEALREAWREKRVTMDELWRCAQICRVANVMRPYLESLI